MLKGADSDNGHSQKSATNGNFYIGPHVVDEVFSGLVTSTHSSSLLIKSTSNIE